MPLATASRRRARGPGARLPDPRGPDHRPTGPLERARAAWAPTSARRPRPALAAAGVLVVLVCAAGGAALAGRQGQRQPVLAVVRDVPAGAPLTAADLGVVDLDGGTGLALVPAGGEAAVVGKRAAFPLGAGMLLAPAALASGAPVPPGYAVVGTSLQPQQVPAELQPGDPVLVVLAGPSTAGGTTPGGGAAPASGTTGTASPAGTASGVLARAVALDVVAPAANGGLGAGGAGGSDATTVDLAVPLADAPAVAAASAAGEVSLALVAPAAAPSGGRRP